MNPKPQLNPEPQSVFSSAWQYLFPRALDRPVPPPSETVLPSVPEEFSDDSSYVQVGDQGQNDFEHSFAVSLALTDQLTLRDASAAQRASSRSMADSRMAETPAAVSTAARPYLQAAKTGATSPKKAAKPPSSPSSPKKRTKKHKK